MDDNNIKKQSNKLPKKKKGIFRITFVTIAIFLFVLIGVGSGILIGLIKSSDSITADDLILKGYTTTIYDQDNKLVSPLNGDKNREWVSINDTPKNLRNAFISIEDKRFYEHPGIDVRRIGGAVFSALSGGGTSHGASTITQQVVRNLSNDFERTLKRKVQEQWKALELERHLTKDQIIEIYMNIIYMGHRCYGVQSSSKLYFGKDVSKLSLAECAVISGITNAPSIYDPFTQKGRENIKKRQEIILSEMLKNEYITKAEYDKAIDEPLNYVVSNKDKNLNTIVQSYFIDQVVLDVKKGLVEKGYSEELALKMIYNNGFKIYTTMDQKIQKNMTEVFTNNANFSKVRDGDAPQGAMVIIDPKNGHVKALYGGSGAKLGSGFNRASASDMMRQPGSTFKPIAVYAPAIDQRKITAATVIDDVPIRLDPKSGKRWPQNYDKTYSGLVTIRDAVKYSLNVVSAKVWTIESGFSDYAFRYIAKVNIDPNNQNNVATSLGGSAIGVNPLKMAASYVPFVNKGLYFEPITYTKVVDSKGKVILENKSDSNTIYESETAYIMTSILSEVVKAGGTASYYGKIQDGRMPSAGKTGTTSDNYDKWFVGYTPYYVGAAWYGYDKQTSLYESEYQRAQKLWHDTMEKVHENLSPKQFVEPSGSGIVKKSICIYSGKTPSKLCANDPRGNAIREEYFIKGTEPSDNDVCSVHLAQEICVDSSDGWGRKQLRGQYCPSTSVKTQIFTRRTKPITLQDDDPYPNDWKYETPNSICKVHTGAQPVISATPEPANQNPAQNTENNLFNLFNDSLNNKENNPNKNQTGNTSN